MTDAMHLRSLPPETYAASFLNTLQDPLLVWDISFRKHITPRCRHLLFSLLFCSEYGVDIDELRTSFNALHPYFCKKFSIEHDPKDFEEAQKILEGGYLEIRDRRVSFVNPSLRDYLITYLADDPDLLDDLAHTAVKASWADELWTYVRTVRPLPPEQQRRVAKSLLQAAQLFPTIPIWKQDSRNPSTWHLYDLSNTDRIRLLLEWRTSSNDTPFMDLALQLANKPAGGHFTVFRDGTGLIRLLRSLKKDFATLEGSAALFEKLEAAVIGLLDGHLFPHEFESFCDVVDAAQDVFETDVAPHIDDAITRQLEDVDSSISDIDSETELSDYKTALQKYAPRVGVTDLKTAFRAIDFRICLRRFFQLRSQGPFLFCHAACTAFAAQNRCQGRARTPRQDRGGRRRISGGREARRGRRHHHTTYGCAAVRPLQTLAEISIEKNPTIIFPDPVRDHRMGGHFDVAKDSSPK